MVGEKGEQGNKSKRKKEKEKEGESDYTIHQDTAIKNSTCP